MSLSAFGVAGDRLAAADLPLVGIWDVGSKLRCIGNSSKIKGKKQAYPMRRLPSLALERDLKMVIWVVVL